MDGKIEATKGFLTETILEVMSEYGKEAAKEQVKTIVANQGMEIAAGVGLDMLGSMIPGIGNAISSYRIQKQMKNLSVLIAELGKRAEEIEYNLKTQSEENKNILDEILEMIVNKAADTSQSEKIRYMINGFTKLASTENISYDISYLYYDLLDRMTILDIAVLKTSYYPIYIDEERKTFVDVMNEFNINNDQYNSIRNNLNRMGLLENKYDESLEKDLKLVVSNINSLNKTVRSIQEALEKPKKKIDKLKNNVTSKLKAKDSLKISKFGRQLVEFFTEEDIEE